MIFPPRFLLATCLFLSANALALGPGAAVPELRAARLGEPGGDLALTALRGQVVYVDFWASWCAPCVRSMPALDALFRKHATGGFVVVGVNKDVDPALARRFAGRVAVGFPLVADGGDQWAKAFGVEAMPSGYLVDRKGVVRHVHRGFTEETPAALEKEIEGLLREPR